MKSLRVGVIGLGSFGESHLRTFRGIPGVEVVAVASRSADRAREIAVAYGVPRWFDDHEALCADPGIDAVTIATEEGLHVAPAVAALAAGKHVLVEKPLATNRADALAIRAASAKATGRLVPGHIVRFEPRFVTLHDAIAGGSLGVIAALHASRNRPRSTLDTYRRCHLALVTAIHDIDAMLWMIGERPSHVRAWQRLEIGHDGIHGIWGTFTFPSGAVATVEATWMMPDNTGLGNGDVFSVTGTRGIANIDTGASGLRMLTTGQTAAPDIGYEPMIHGAIGGALQAELSHFVRLARNSDIQPVVTVDDGVRAVISAEAMIESATLNKEIAIEWPSDLT
jgi:UDP-N-acetylglucosamine 3-dehydrogenase